MYACGCRMLAAPRRIAMPREREWMKLIPEEDLRTYREGGFLGVLKLGTRTALIVVDVTYGFTGSEGLTLEQAIREYPTACGPASWEAMPRIRRLIELFRARSLPLVFTRNNPETIAYAGTTTKSQRDRRPPARFNDFPPTVAPRDGEWVLAKPKASAFFHTALTAYLVREKVDSLVFCGVSTSGCVRASVVDGFSHGYATFVVDECCFDRSYFAHCANLFDMQAKYASVVSLDEVEALLGPTRKASAA
jgi:nicotinamidase-related amidase